ncbi:MAG: glycosyl hydrolase, partial [Flavobacteriaceae bacterium]
NSIIKRYSNIQLPGGITKTNLTNALLTSSPRALKVSPYTTSSSLLLVGTVLGDLLKVENANTASPTWTEISGPSFVGSISDIEFGTNENEIFVTMHNYSVVSIWYTSDGGATWANKEGDFPDIPVKTILQNPLNTDEVIIGTELGVWKTSNFKDATPNWTHSFNGMSNVKVLDLNLR